MRHKMYKQLLAWICAFILITLRVSIHLPLLHYGQATVVIEIPQHTSAAQLVRILATKHLIISPNLWLCVIRIGGFASKLRAGYYQIQPGDTGISLLRKIVHGTVLVKTFKIIEGTTSIEVMHNLAVAPYLNYNQVAVDAASSDIAKNHQSLEGLLLADTYFYDAGSAAADILLRAHVKLQQNLHYYWNTRSDNLPYKNPYELLTAASILEKETASAVERKIIAGIIVNRLNLHMPLQMDPTVIYPLHLKQHNFYKLHHRDLTIDSPYNTYLHRGLPPTPIALIGQSALEAASHPLQVDYLYFYANGDGSHQFSRTYTEQKQAIKNRG